MFHSQWINCILKKYHIVLENLTFLGARLDWESYSDLFSYHKCEYYIRFGSIFSESIRGSETRSEFILSQVIETHALMGSKFISFMIVAVINTI